MHALVVADGDAPARVSLDAAFPGWDSAVGLVVAADGGARACAGLGHPPDLIVGDGDSLGAAELDRFEAAGVAVERSPTDKDETDTELAIVAALRRGATRLTIVGAFGGERLDHELANLWLLALPALADRPTCLLDARARVTLLCAPDPDGRPVERGLPGRPGGLVSLLPFGGDADGVTTRGLRYVLADEVLPIGPSRGLSNVRVSEDAAVSLRHGRLLVVEGPATLVP
jgi:thiamine pyrophosphokinase